MLYQRLLIFVFSTSLVLLSLSINSARLAKAASSSMITDLNTAESVRTDSILDDPTSLLSSFDYQPKSSLIITQLSNSLIAMSTITVTKVASPTAIPEPGRSVNFVISVTNGYTAAATLQSLNDSKFGSLAGKGTCILTTTTTVSPNSTYTCNFTEFITGNAGDTHTNVITAVASYSATKTVTVTDTASVSFTDVPSSIQVTKSANPTSVPESGGNVSYTVRITNTSSADNVQIQTVLDNKFGNIGIHCNLSLPATIAPNQTITCPFSQFISGNAGTSHNNTVTVSGTDDDQKPVSGNASTTVNFTNVNSSIDVFVQANLNSVPEPGGAVEFTLQIENTSAVDTVTIQSLTDNVLGDLSNQGDCQTGQDISPGDLYECTYSAEINGVESETQLRTVTVQAIDDDNVSLTKSGSTSILVGAKPLSSIYLPFVHKPLPTELSVFNDNTGGNVTFTVFGTGVSCVVPNNATLVCGTFPPGTYTVEAVTVGCGVGTSVKTYGSGAQTTRVFCK